MKKPIIISFSIGAVIMLAVIAFFVIRNQWTPSNPPVNSASGDFNTYDEEAERRAEALSDSGIVSAEIIAATGATQVMTPKMESIPDVSSQEEAPVGDLIEE